MIDKVKNGSKKAKKTLKNDEKVFIDKDNYYVVAKETHQGYGFFIYDRMQKLKIDIDSMADAIGVRKRQVVSWIREIQFPHITNIICMVYVLDLSDDELFEVFGVKMQKDKFGALFTLKDDIPSDIEA